MNKIIDCLYSVPIVSGFIWRLCYLSIVPIVSDFIWRLCYLSIFLSFSILYCDESEKKNAWYIKILSYILLKLHVTGLYKLLNNIIL